MTDTILPNRAGPENQNGSRSQSESSSDSSEALVRMPFHGTCPRCKHFHKGKPITFSANGQTHTRIVCEKCGHHIGGLGRTETQFSLASVDSFPVNDTGTVTIPGPSLCMDVARGTTLAIPEEAPRASEETERGDTTPIDALAAAITAEETPSTPGSPRETVSVPSNAESLRSWNISNLWTITQNVTSPLWHFLGSYSLPTWFEGIRRPFRGAHTGFMIFGWQLSVQLYQPAEAGIPIRPTPGRHGSSSASTNGSMAISSRVSNHSDPVQGSQSSNSDFAIQVTPRSAEGHRRRVSRGPFSETDPGRRKQHLYEIRREKTLGRRALHRVRCRCRHEFDLVSSEQLASHLSIASSSSRRRPAAQEEDIASNIFGRIQVPPAHIGMHPELRMTSERHSSSPSGTSSQRLDSLSRTPTLVPESETGSISLQTERPRLPPRSQSTPIVLSSQNVRH